MRNVQIPLYEVLVRDTCPVQDWIVRFERLVPLLYVRDAALARDLEVELESLSSTAGDLDCVGSGDPDAPPPNGATDQVLSYLSRRFPETRPTLRRLISQADQALGRATLLRTVACAHLDSPAATTG